MQSVGNVSGTGEHHVFEQVRETGADGHLVLRADVIPDVDRNCRRRAIDRKNQCETVRKFVRLERNFELRHGCLREAAGDEEGD